LWVRRILGMGGEEGDISKKEETSGIIINKKAVLARNSRLGKESASD
jgi:hypothetical protein